MKQYFTPMLLTAGGIDITVSQEGDIGTGTVYDSIIDILTEWGITSGELGTLGLSQNPADSSWQTLADTAGLHFNANDPTTWDAMAEYIVNQLYPS